MMDKALILGEQVIENVDLILCAELSMMIENVASIKDRTVRFG